MLNEAEQQNIMHRNYVTELPKHSQTILAIASHFFHERDFGNGIHHYPLTKLYEEVGPYLVLAQRAMLEKNDNFRQVLPYKVITQFDGRTGQNKIVAYRRLNKGGEARLHGLMSIGFGGHVDLKDVICYRGDEQARSTIDLESTIHISSRRELAEEVRLRSEDGRETPFDAAGVSPGDMFIHYSLHEQLGESWRVEDDVHSVHVAFVMKLAAPVNLQVVSGEPDVIEMLPPMTVQELLASGMPMEEWTRLLLEYMARTNASA